MNSSISSRVSALRVFLKDHGLNGWIVPTADPHLSEYVDEHYAFRKWLSGFTGSAGSLLVTQDAAALVTDSRYWVQAEQHSWAPALNSLNSTKATPRSLPTGLPRT